MIIQLHGYPIEIDGEQRGANNSSEYKAVAIAIRSILLNECDWVMMPDNPISEEVKQEWVSWRQTMRDLPSTFSFEMGETLEIPDPPITCRPSSWVNVTPDAPWMNTHNH